MSYFVTRVSTRQGHRQWLKGIVHVDKSQCVCDLVTEVIPDDEFYFMYDEFIAKDYTLVFISSTQCMEDFFISGQNPKQYLCRKLDVFKFMTKSEYEEFTSSK